MLDGWYCRTMANEQAQAEQNEDDEGDGNNVDSNGSDDDSQDEGTSRINQKMIDYKIQYNSMKKKLKFLLYENEYFQDALRSSQRRLLKVTRDKSFLIERLLQYEKPEITSSESEETETSDEETRMENTTKKRKMDNAAVANSTAGGNQHNHTNSGGTTMPKAQNAVKRKRVPKQKQNFAQVQQHTQMNHHHHHPHLPHHVMTADGHMTTEEVERHLQSRQPLMELVPERAPPTVPNEMFSNEPSLDSESNDQMIETSPSNIGEECLSVDMNNFQD